PGGDDHGAGLVGGRLVTTVQQVGDARPPTGLESPDAGVATQDCARRPGLGLKPRGDLPAPPPSAGVRLVELPQQLATEHRVLVQHHYISAAPRDLGRGPQAGGAATDDDGVHPHGLPPGLAWAPRGRWSARHGLPPNPERRTLIPSSTLVLQARTVPTSSTHTRHSRQWPMPQ